MTDSATDMDDKSDAASSTSFITGLLPSLALRAAGEAPGVTLERADEGASLPVPTPPLRTDPGLAKERALCWDLAEYGGDEGLLLPPRPLLLSAFRGVRVELACE